MAAILIMILTFVFIVVSIVSVDYWRARRAAEPIPTEGVSVLKPLCGADDDLQDNLRTFFEQDHPAFELVFGIQGHDDPAIDIVRQLADEYPDVPHQIVVHDGAPGINPKVVNLRATLDRVRHDIVVISDSNCAVRPDYLRQLTVPLEAGAGLTTSLVAGTGEERLGSTLDNLHMNGHVMGGIAASHLVGSRPAVLGKSMAFRLSQFEALGGFESIATVLAEDYVIGRMFAEGGHRIEVAPGVVDNVNRTQTVTGFWKRQLRWSMLRARLNPIRYALEPLSMPILASAIAVSLGGPGWLLLLGLGMSLVRDAIQWTLLRGPAGLLSALPWTVLREAIAGVAWAVAPFKRHVGWRGNRVRLSAGTRLYARPE